MLLRDMPSVLVVGSADPPALVTELLASWRQAGPEAAADWGAALLPLVQLANGILCAAMPGACEGARSVQVSQAQCWELLKGSEEFHDSLEKLQQSYFRRGVVNG